MSQPDAGGRAAGFFRSLLDALRAAVEGPRFQTLITIAILVNAVTLGLDTSEKVRALAGPVLDGIDRAILALFVFELLVKLVAYRIWFFRSGWNIFDFVIVGISLVPATGNLSVLRAFRILRVLRLLSVVPQLRRVVEALLSSIPGMGAIMGVLTLFFYVGAVLATRTFGEGFPQWFGDVGASMYTLFQIMTLESWSMGIVRPVMEKYPLAWIFFVPFIFVTSFMVLNLFIAIIVNSMNALHQEDVAALQEADAHSHEDHVALIEEIRALRSEVQALKQEIHAANGTGHADPPTGL